MGHHVTLVDVDLCAHFAQRAEVEIHRTGADGTASRQRHARFMAARQQRTQHPEACPHPRDEMIGRRGVGNLGCGEVDRFASANLLAGAAALGVLVHTVIVQNAFQKLYVCQPRQVAQGERFRREQAGDHQRKGGVLGP
jgi:hypothetical protein